MSAYKSSPKYIFYLFLILSTLSLLSAPAVAAPPADGNFWYQTITIESDETVTDGLYHVWIPFPYDWSDGNYDSYRMYYENGTDVPFHIFSANGSQISLSFKGNLTTGNNIFYLSAGNFSLSSVQTTDVYDDYSGLVNITANTTYSTNSYNFAQMIGIHKNSNNLSGAYTAYQFKSLSDNASLKISRNTYTNRTVSVSKSTSVLNSTIWNSTSLGFSFPYFYAIDSINSESSNIYYTTYSVGTNGAGINNMDIICTTDDFTGSAISINSSNYTNANITVSYAAGNYTDYKSLSISEPTEISNDFLVISLFDLDTGKIYSIDGTQYRGTQRKYGVFFLNRTSDSYFPLSGAFSILFYTNFGNHSLNGWSNASVLRIVSHMNTRTTTYIIQNRPVSIKLTGDAASAVLPIDFEGPQLKIPYVTAAPFTGTPSENTGKNAIYTLVLDTEGNPVPSATVEYYIYGSQLDGAQITSDFGVAGHRATARTNYAVFGEKRNFGNDSIQVVTGPSSHSSDNTGSLLILESKGNISITVRDYDTLEVVSNYTAYLGENQRLRSTDNGTVEYDNVTNGVYDIVLVSDGYNQVSRKINVTSAQRDFSLYMTKTEDGNGSEQVTTPQYITYYVRNQNNTPLQNVLVSVYEINGTDLLMSKMTGVDGSATFTFNRTLNYRIEFTYAGQNESVTLSGSQSSYYVVYLNVSSPGPSVSLFDRLTASMRVSSINNTSVIISAMVVDRLASLEFGENTTYSISPNITQESVQFGTGFVIVNYIVDRSVYDEWAQNAQVVTFRATVENESETVDLIATLIPKKSGSDLLDITIPDEIKLGIIIGAMILMTFGSTAFNTASITYVAALLPILFGSWLTWITVPLPILLLFVARLVLVIMYDMRKQDK